MRLAFRVFQVDKTKKQEWMKFQRIERRLGDRFLRH
jgi:hypothetical protein